MSHYQVAIRLIRGRRLAILEREVTAAADRLGVSVESSEFSYDQSRLLSGIAEVKELVATGRRIASDPQLSSRMFEQL